MSQNLSSISKYAKREQEELDFDRDIAKFSPRQLDAIAALDSGSVKYLLYGGAVGGGKSYFLRWYAIRRLMEFAQMGHRQVVAGLFCEDYPALKDRQIQKIAKEFPPWLGRMHTDHREYGRCFILAPEYGSGIIAFRNLDDPAKYASAEFALILVDELTKNDYDLFTHLRTRLRWAGLSDMECFMLGATNPGGVGHNWVKQLWMDKSFPDEFKYPVDYRPTFCYIPSKADDNPHLDPGYWAMLETLPPDIRKAFRDGNWDIFLGQAFTFVRERHVINPLPVPELAPLYMTYDWGFGAPFSIGWWWTDEDGRGYRFSEWYGWNGQPNTGLRWTDDQVAEGIIDREKDLGIWGRHIIRWAGPDCFNKKPDYKGGGQGESTAETFSKYGIHLTPGDPDRKLKIRKFRERMRIPKNDNEMPMIVVYNTCSDGFIRTIPNLVVNKNNIEDVDTSQEDHVYDEACHFVMGRPTALEMESIPKFSQAQIDHAIIHGEDLDEITEEAINIDE